MINKPSNWDNVQVFSDRPKLPVGGYVCKIKQGVVKDNGYGPQLCIVFDIDEGDYAGFYQDDFDSNKREDKKWKGVLRLWLPKNDGSEKDDTTTRILKGFVTSVEESNSGYSWNWNEASLKGKYVGIIMRAEEWEYNGKTGWTARPFRSASVETIRNQDYTIPDQKPLKDKPAETTYTEITDDDSGELPF